MTATFCPAPASRRASAGPDCPVPMMIASKLAMAFSRERCVRPPGTYGRIRSICRGWIGYHRRSAALPCEPNKDPMARIFVSGSSTGLGLMAGQLLAEHGHQVVLHARNARRADATRRALAGAAVV